jgi:hypothetical protein
MDHKLQEQIALHRWAVKLIQEFSGSGRTLMGSPAR